MNKFIYIFTTLFLISTLSIPIFKNDMEDFVIQDKSEVGKFYFYNTDYCLIRNCSGNNVDSPYGIVTFPSRNYNTKYDKVAFDIYENEYIELVVKTPSKSLYFSFTMYLFDRDYMIGEIPVSATVNDTLNSYKIENQLKKSPFDTDIRILYTHNANIEKMLYDRYANDSNVFIQTFYDFDVDTRQFTPEKDRLAIFMRIILMEDRSSLQKYINRPPISVYRHTLYGDPFQTMPKGNGVWKTRSKDGQNENMDVDEFLTLLSVFDRHIKQYTQLSAYDMFVKKHQNHIRYDIGWDCIYTGVTCNIDNRDTNYIHGGCPDESTSFEFIKGINVQDNSLLFVMGTNHTFYDNAIYHSIQLYDDELNQGIFSFQSTSNNYENTSRTYLDSCRTLWNFFEEREYPYTREKYFCLLYSREPFEFWRLPESMRMYYVHVRPDMIPTKHTFIFVERSYLQSQLSISADTDMFIFYQLKVYTNKPFFDICQY